MKEDTQEEGVER